MTNTTVSEDTASHRLVFSGPQTIRVAGPVRETLREAITEHPSVRIDCADVTEADLTFIQLLIAARLTAHDAGRQVAFHAAPAGAVLAAVTAAGLSVGPDANGAVWFAGAPS